MPVARRPIPESHGENDVSQRVYSVNLNYNTVDPRPPCPERSTPAIMHAIEFLVVAAAIVRPGRFTETEHVIAN